MAEALNNANVNEAAVESKESTAEAKEKTSYSAEEVQQMMAEGKKEAEERAVKNAQKEFEKQQREAQRLAKMNEDEKEKYAMQKRIDELESQAKQFVIAENKNQLSLAMADRGLPVQFVDYLVSDDADQMMDNLKSFEKQWKKAISAEVDARVKTATPKTGTSGMSGNGTMTKKEFAKLSLSQQAQLYADDPDLYKQLTGY